MSFIKEISNFYCSTRYYTSDLITCAIEAVEWIYTTKNMESLIVDCIHYRDLWHRSDEGSDSIQLNADVSLSEMINNYNTRDVDVISINGEYDNVPVVRGVDLRNRNIFLTTRNKIPADIKSIEKKLQLNLKESWFFFYKKMLKSCIFSFKIYNKKRKKGNIMKKKTDYFGRELRTEIN